MNHLASFGPAALLCGLGILACSSDSESPNLDENVSVPAPSTSTAGMGNGGMPTMPGSGAGTGDPAGAPGAGGSGNGPAAGAANAGGETGEPGEGGGAGVAAGGAATGGNGGRGGDSAGGAMNGGAGGMDVGPASECVAMVDGAKAFLAALSDQQRDTASYDFGAAERKKFEFLPPNGNNNPGLTIKNIDASQRTLLETFLKVAMSDPGYLKASQVMAMEQVLKNTGDNPGSRDPDNYFISFYGEPSVDGDAPWGYRFGGHHLSLHASVIACKQYSATPAFWGISPWIASEAVPGLAMGDEPLKEERALAAQLFMGLDADQKPKAEGPKTQNAINTKNNLLDPYAAEGLKAGEMTTEQKDLLRKLIGAYVGNMAEPIATQRLAAIEDAGFDDITFVYGTDGAGPYYQVRGPTFVVEYITAAARHIHTVWRDYAGDFGEDLMARHMAEFHSGE